MPRVKKTFSINFEIKGRTAVKRISPSNGAHVTHVGSHVTHVGEKGENGGSCYRAPFHTRMNTKA